MSIKKYTLLLLFISLITIISSCSISKKNAQKYFAASQNKTYDIIVVPGYPLLDTLLWDRIMKARVYWAKYLMDKGIAKNIMFSGSAVYTPYYEAKIMSLYAQQLGITKEKIYVETRAEHSTENIYYSYKKAKKMGFKTIAFASDPFQTKQIRRYIKSLSKDIVLIPIVYDTLRTLEPTMTDPKIKFHDAYEKNFTSIKERESLWKRVKGTLGRNVDKLAYE